MSLNLPIRIYETKTYSYDEEGRCFRNNKLFLSTYRRISRGKIIIGEITDPRIFLDMFPEENKYKRISRISLSDLNQEIVDLHDRFEDKANFSKKVNGNLIRLINRNFDGVEYFIGFEEEVDQRQYDISTVCGQIKGASPNLFSKETYSYNEFHEKNGLLINKEPRIVMLDQFGKEIKTRGSIAYHYDRIKDIEL